MKNSGNIARSTKPIHIQLLSPFAGFLHQLTVRLGALVIYPAHMLHRQSFLHIGQVIKAILQVKRSDQFTKFFRQSKRMKAQKAIVAVARRLLKVVYNTLETLTIYKEKGIAHFVDLQAKAALCHSAKLSWPQTDNI